MVRAQHKCGCMLLRKELRLPIARCHQHGPTEIDAAHDWTHFVWYAMSHNPTGVEGPRPSDKKVE